MKLSDGGKFSLLIIKNKEISLIEGLMCGLSLSWVNWFWFSLECWWKCGG